jgi:hypothetical protein
MSRWSAYQLWALGPVLASVVAITDLFTGHQIVLIGLLVIGPVHVMLTGRWLWTALTSVWVVGLAVALGLHDGIWGTETHVVLIAAVAAAGCLATLEATALRSRGVV